MSRSENMRRIKSAETGPELAVRLALRELGFRGYRLHRADLPGRPDIAFVGRKKAVFVHGCFWHGHSCRRGFRTPKSNADYWITKVARNKARDGRAVAELAGRGWSILLVWECEISDPDALRGKLKAFMKAPDLQTI
jgi:DNA mismatch endonuclease, patch repair protein